MRRYFWMGLLGLLLGVAPAFAQDSTSTPSPKQFLVNEVSPAAGSEILSDTPLTFTFNRVLNCNTVTEASVQIQPAVEGEWACQLNTLTFIPAVAYADQTAYQVQISDAVRSMDTQALTETSTFYFYTAGFLHVTEMIPADTSTNIPTYSPITVVFNRPVVPLIISDEKDRLPHPLTITPKVAGTGEWINTFIYTFVPSEMLSPGTTYTVKVADDLATADGATLVGQTSWTFSTVPPSMRAYPYNLSNNVQLDSRITLEFNALLSQKTVEENFILRPIDFPDDYRVEGIWEWDESGLRATFTPKNLLTNQTVYLAKLDSSALVVGSDPQDWLDQWTFTTLPYPVFMGPAPADGATTDIYSGFGLRFNTYMNTDSITERLTIDPAPPEDSFVGYLSGTNYTGAFPARASTTYHIVVEPGYSDIYGNVVNERIEFSYTTDRYQPAFNLAIPGGQMGFYNAYYDQTALFIQHRNVNKVGIELYRFSTEEFLGGYLDGDGYGYNAPQDQGVPRTLIRRDELTLDAQENVFAPTYLALGQDKDAVCGTAPASRLTAGDFAEISSSTPLALYRGHLPAANMPTPTPVLSVTPIPDPYQPTATPFPPPTAIPPNSVLYQGYMVELVTGPNCVEGEWLWQIRLSNGALGWLPETQQGEYVLQTVPMTSTQIQVNPDSEALPPGIYYLNVSMIDPQPPDRRYGYSWGHYLLVSTAVLTMKTSVDSVVVWATDVATGKPIANAPITLYNRAGILGGGITNADGIVRFDLPMLPDNYLYRSTFMAVLQTETQFGLGSSDLTRGIDPGNFGIGTAYRQEEYSIYLFLDRAAYRPGEIVYYRGTIRRKDDARYYPPEFSEIAVAFNNGEETIVHPAELSPYGTFSGSFEIVDNASLGSQYYVRAITPDTPTQPSMQREISFSVAEFTLPEFEVKAQAEKADLVQGEAAVVTVESHYYFGGNVSGATVDYTVQTAPYNFVYRGKGNYSFRRVEEDFEYYDGEGRRYGSGRTIAEGSVETDTDGKAIIEVPTVLEQNTLSQRLLITATVRDSTDRTVSAGAVVQVHAGDVYIGSSPERYVSRENEANALHLIAVDLNSQPLANAELTAQLYEVKWYNVQERDSNGRTAWTWEKDTTLITEAILTSDADGKTDFVFTPEKAGGYEIITSTRDSKGNLVTNLATFWVTGNKYASWRQSNDNRIDLVANATSYNVGDTAEILIASPFQGTATALITIERGDFVSYEVIEMDTNSYVYKLPIRREHIPNIYVSVIVMKGVDDDNPVAGFRMGMVALKVNTDQKLLKLEVTRDTEQAQPQQTVSYTLKVTDYQGKPVVAEIGVAVTDAAALAVGNRTSPDLLPFYYSEAPIGVFTSTPLTINTDAITQQILDTIKGGGGGGLALPFTFDVRQDFASTPYWEATLVTNAEGIATFSVKLPDNLTTWRLDARAITLAEDGDMLIGQTTDELVSARPLLVRPITPRFFVVGDRLWLGAVVNNSTNQELETTVKLESFGLVLTEPDSQTQIVKVPAKGSARVNWEVTVQDVAGVELVFAAESGAYNDAARPMLAAQNDDFSLPVYRYEVPATAATGGILLEEGSRTETIQLPQTINERDDAGEVRVRVDTSLAAGMIDTLAALETDYYYCECIPYVVSRLMPNLATARALQTLQIENEALDDQVQATVDWALQRLYIAQRADGGWGWYFAEESNPITTAYALIGLHYAQMNGYGVNATTLRFAQDYVASRLVGVSDSLSKWELNRQAFLLYALAISGRPDVARMSNLFEHYERLNLDAQIFLALALYEADPENRRLDALLASIISHAKPSATGMFWEESWYDSWNWSSNTRTTALALYALIKLKPDSELIPQGVRWLMVARQQDAWETDQETAWSVLALTDWMIHTGELLPEYSYTVAWNDNPLLLEDARAATLRESQVVIVPRRDMTESNTLVVDRTEGDGVLYYTAHLRLILPVPEVQAQDNGIIIQRQYSLMNDEEETPITGGKVGDLVRVRLTIIAPQALHYVTILDPIPAGAELINPNLPINPRQNPRSFYSRNGNQRYGWGWWYFPTIQYEDEQARLSASYLPAGTYDIVYTMRLGLAGTFNVIPPTAEETYFPEINGRGEGILFTIEP